jgi:hypothetical protein
MCLTEEFFEARGNKLDELAVDGHVDVELFMKVCDLDWGDLVAAGLVRSKRLQSTADLLAFEPTPGGRQYLKAYKAEDVLVVLRGKGALLLACCKNG